VKHAQGVGRGPTPDKIVGAEKQNTRVRRRRREMRRKKRETQSRRYVLITRQLARHPPVRYKNSYLASREV
jgi:hypothetical protein